MQIEKLKPGMVVYDVGMYTMGNTKIKSVAIWSVFVQSVDIDAGVVVASWNSNTPKRYYQSSWSKWRIKKPQLVSLGFGRYRLAKRGEVVEKR